MKRTNIDHTRSIDETTMETMREQENRESPMAEPLSVLLVEDSDNDALLLARQLKQGGFDADITRVQTEEEMHEALESRVFDIILSDWHLPTFSGLQAFSKVRELEVETPFIIVSGVVGEETAIEAMHAGVQDYVMKDKLKRLVPAIQRELTDAEARRQRREAQAALRETEERFSLFMHHLPGAAYIKDDQGKYIFANDRAHRILKDIDSVLSREVHELLPTQFAEAMQATDRKVLQERREVETVDTIKVDDQETTYLTIKFPIPQVDGKRFLGGISIDITERKRAEDQLRALTKELQERHAELEKKTIALSEILSTIEAEKNSIKDQISNNIEQRILPTLRRLSENAPHSLDPVIEVLEKEMLEIASPFVQTLQQKASALTSRELEVCRMIKHGLTTKEIAETLNLSPATVQKHRETIRRKLGISGADVNLHTFLQTI